MCNYPNNTVITLKNINTGDIIYTFAHWPTPNDCYTAVVDYPSHKTQVIEHVPMINFEIIDRKDWSM